MKLVSFIIPCYNSACTIRTVVESIIRITDGLFDTEIILINDGSRDDTWMIILSLCREYKNIIGINLSRNFGQQSARMAGVSFANGDYAVFMDDDGQHDPQYIPTLIESLESGYDIVYADFKHDQTSIWRKIGSYFRFVSARLLEGTPSDIHPTAFFAIRKFLIEGLKQYPSPTPSVFGYLLKSTRNVGTIPIDKKNRLNGRSGYTLHKLISTWLNEMVGFSIVPLRISSVMGLFSSFSGLVLALFFVIQKILYPDIPLGYTSTIVVILFFCGVILLVLGIIGEYIGRLCMTINKTPQFMIREVLNHSAKNIDNRESGG